MAVRVQTTAAGTVGDRPGGLQVVIGALLSTPGNATVTVAAPLDTATNDGVPQTSTGPNDRPRPNDQAESNNSIYFGRKPSGTGEAVKVLWAQYKDRIERWAGITKAAEQKRNSDGGAGGPQAEVRPQWLADP